ncbi:hypothetical protein [Nocardia sp. alder85J]|uniref:hypothetical protein n=1 Tax=Nocardia sp. alder85J TaxID=2862949 RepID=UPI001CD456A1|nr:hypothetical protein [Nocardia sp. alder85J]MCX4094994.1 hypothetical protein [Nocardia sp. alder85J]
MPPDGSWSPSRGAARPRYTHTGSNTLWAAAAWSLPDENIIAVAATNRGDLEAREPPVRMALGLVEAYTVG